MVQYSEKVMQHFMTPHNVGEINDADGKGEIGNPVCGDMMTFYIKVKDNIIEEKCNFEDILNHWGADDITSLCELGYIEGYGDYTFKPNKHITRAEASKLVALWLDNNIGNSHCDANLYSDVSCDDWYGKYIGYLSSKNILEGYDKSIFKPEKHITRAETLKIILYARELQYTNLDDATNPFSDVNKEDWFYSIVITGNDLLIVQGYEDGTFRPNNPLTRAEFVKIFTKTLI